ncbi:MAG: transcriptional repressor [Pedobacter sp.]|nr:MAG: transcriptional repressor [Pedobacter sp.]
MSNNHPDEVLRAHGLKNTKQRQIVLEELAKVNSAISQPELEKKVGNAMDRVTLYRILSTFQEKGIVHSVMDQNGTNNYASCSPSCKEGHHHDDHLHFNCTNCSKIYCLDVKIPAIKMPAGFTAQTINTIASGICVNCK